MKDFSIKLVALLSAGLAVSSTFADCEHGGYSGGYGGGYSYSDSSSSQQQSESSDDVEQSDESAAPAAPVQPAPAPAPAAAPLPSTASGSTVNIGGQSAQPNGGQVFNGRALEPIHSTHNPLPTDNFFIVSLKEYGTSDAAPFIAAFNGMQPSDSLANVARLQMPSISKDGKTSQSRSPLSDADLAAKTAAPAPAAAAAPVQPAPAPAPAAAPLPSIASGSTVKIGGQTLGDNSLVRLRVGGLALPVEVVERSSESVTVRLPKLEVTAATKAELEVVRADGTLAAKSGLNLTPTTAKPAQAVVKK